MQVGFLVLAAFASITISGFAEADPASLWRYRGELEHAQARVLAIEKTHNREGRSVRAGRIGARVLRFDAEFEFGGARHTAASYSSTKRLEPGALVEVEFPRGEPQFARIVGTRSAPLSPLTLLFAIAPVLTAVALGRSLAHSAAALRLVRSGSLAAGLVQPADPLQGRRWFPGRQVCVHFESEPGRRVELELGGLIPALFGVGRSVHVLFDPRQPERGRVVEALAFELPVDQRGQIRAMGFARLARYLIAPLVLLAVVIGAALVA